MPASLQLHKFGEKNSITCMNCFVGDCDLLQCNIHVSSVLYLHVSSNGISFNIEIFKYNMQVNLTTLLNNYARVVNNRCYRK